MTSPTDMAQRQLDAYNARDIEAFLACYAPDVEVRDFPSGALTMEGREAMRARYGDMFARCPDLHARLYAEAVRELRTFSEGAQADRTEYEGDMDLPPYSKHIDYVAAGETGKLISLQRNSSEYTGGAHPNPAYGAVIWDKALKQFVQPAQLFRRGADLSALDQALCDALNTARRGRNPDAQPIGLNPTQGGWSCPRAGTTPFVLAPSTTPGKAGGLIFLIGPYQVGPYAEGGYEVAIPQSVFRSLLAPAYADEFAGQPPRTGDVTDLG